MCWRTSSFTGFPGCLTRWAGKGASRPASTPRYPRDQLRAFCLQGRFVTAQSLAVDVHEQDQAHICRSRPKRSDGLTGSEIGREAISAGRDRRETHRAGSKFVGNLEATAVAGGEHVDFTPFPAPPDRSHRVDDVAGREGKAGCGFGFARLAASQRRARSGQLGLARGLVDSAVRR